MGRICSTSAQYLSIYKSTLHSIRNIKIHLDGQIVSLEINLRRDRRYHSGGERSPKVADKTGLR